MASDRNFAMNGDAGRVTSSSGVPSCWKRPPSSTATRSARASASERSCVTCTTVSPSSRVSVCSSRRRLSRSGSSSAESASSSSSTRGLPTSARAIATRCRCPPESVAGLRFA
ncbi:hypothetical protein ACFPRL_14215 [Pseudoclavibacter helvolus]